MGKTDLEAALTHKYRVTAGGETIPGVTTVIKACTPIYALPWAAAKIAAGKMADLWLDVASGQTHTFDLDAAVELCRREPDRQWKEKASRGTRVHDVAERWTRGETVDVAMEDSGFVDALESFHLMHKPVFTNVEKVVLNYWSEYGGRIDGVAEFDGGRFLIDWKTGNYYPYEVALQCAAYLEARVAEYDDEGALIDINTSPLIESVDGARVIYLSEDGTFNVVDPFQAVSQADAILAFGAALQLYKINQRINRSIKEMGKQDAERID
jgi:hypothetical protein